MIKVGINGFGRIGRLVFRAAQKRSDIQVVGINDLISVEYMAYMLKYDSVHGQFDGTIDIKDGNLVVNGNVIRVTAERNPAQLKDILMQVQNTLLCLLLLKTILQCSFAV